MRAELVSVLKRIINLKRHYLCQVVKNEKDIR